MEILNKTVNVKNRGTGEVGYTLPDTGVRRTWMPGEVKKSISVAELEQATYIPGGQKLMQKYLVINDKSISKTEISAGETPLIRLACPRLKGFTWFSLSLASSLKPCIVE